MGEVWNSKQYEDARRYCSDPTEVEKDPTLEDHFCHGCPALFETNVTKNLAWGNDSTFEETQGEIQKAAAQQSAARVTAAENG